MTPRPHDLLWIADENALSFIGARPDWLPPDWLLRAPLVVRRDSRADPALCLPVGLRGLQRRERCAAIAARGAVLRTVTPEMLAARACEIDADGVPALAALAVLAPALDAIGLVWGPTGGVGFYLASGLPVLRPDSDLDLLVRAPQALDAAQTAALAALQANGCRIDIQVDTGHGAFALAEWGKNSGRVLLKTAAGPVLTGAPWQVAA